MKLRNKKTGEIKDALLYVQGGNDFDSLAELNEEWEDYTPKEPLIKDPKIRKAVRAWAEVVGEKESFIATYSAEYHDCCIYTADLSNTSMIDLGTDLNISEGSYTITELCGEEGEC